MQVRTQKLLYTHFQHRCGSINIATNVPNIIRFKVQLQLCKDRHTVTACLTRKNRNIPAIWKDVYYVELRSFVKSPAKPGPGPTLQPSGSSHPSDGDPALCRIRRPFCAEWRRTHKNTQEPTIQSYHAASLHSDTDCADC